MSEIRHALVLHQQVADAGVPIDGVSGPPWSVQYATGATKADRQLGDSIAAAFDGKGLTSRDPADVIADLAQLPPDDMTKLLLAVVAKALDDDPGLAKRAGVNVTAYQKG